MPLILFGILFIIVFIKHFNRKTNRTVSQATKEFWRKENEANCARKQSTDDIKYIPFTMDCLPSLNTTTTELSEYYSKLAELSGKPIANLSGYTNTELKLKYGAANFLTLYKLDENYIKLIRILNQLSEYLVNHDAYEDAIPYLLYSIQIDQTVKSYLLLARIYIKLDKKEELLELKQESAFLPDHKKTPLLRMIKKEEQDALCDE